MFRSSAIVELTVLLWLGFGSAASGSSSPASLQPAIRRGNQALVQQLVASGADINAVDEAGTTPLTAAVLAGNPQILSYLLAHGADVNARQWHGGSTALLSAVLAGRRDLAQILLAAGARCDLRFADGESVLHRAAKHGDPAMIELLLAANADLKALDDLWNTPLDDAVMHDRKDAAATLLRHGADPRRVHPRDGRGPLHEACIEGSSVIAVLLIRAGADPTLRDRSDQTPLDLALAYKNKPVIAAFLALAAEYPGLRADFGRAMEMAARRGRTETAGLLIAAGWSVNQPTTEGSTYLNEAALRGQTAMARLLLDHGARLDSRNRDGGTPLHDAALSGSTEIIALLLDRGAPVDAEDRESGATPLMLAASLGRGDAVALLLKRGANPSVIDRTGRTALSRARDGKYANLVKLLQDAHKAPPVPRPS